MTATESRLTAPPAGLLAAVAERYEGAPFVPLRVLKGGWANDVFLLSSERGQVVLRVKHPPSEPASIAWEHAQLQRLKPAIPEVVAPIRARDGCTFFLFEGDAVTLVPFVDGSPADRASAGHRLGAARLLARVHAATANLPVEARPGPEGLQQLRSLDTAGVPSEWRGRVERLYRDAIALLERLDTRPLVHGAVHGDFFRGNVLVRDDEVVALLDWEEAHVAPLVSELANGVWEFCQTGDYLERESGAAFVAAYREAGGPVPGGEDDLIVPLIQAKRVLELLRAPADRRVDWEYQAHNLRSAENLR
jgi:Ser/Thr protein kinase RdoA (MazF antagonist)